MAGGGTAHLRGTDTLLRVEHLVVEYRAAKTNAKVQAVSDISFDIKQGETLGLVGESGCGKSSTGRAVMMLQPPTAGSVMLDRHDLTAMTGENLRRLRSRIQMVFQDPISSLNPRRKIKDIIGEGLTIWGHWSEARVLEMMEAVGLDPELADRKPHEFSGGQCQRISIARALAMEPDIIVCDEPVSALDVSIQAQILTLLKDMKERYGLTLLFIAHDLAVVKNISDRVAVMYLGKLCEVGASDDIYKRPRHPYTDALLEAAPTPTPGATRQSFELRGDPASPINPPSGCRFRTRCPKAQQECAEREPEMREMGRGQYVACHFPLD